MKKYLFGLLAVVFAVAFSAFKTPVKKLGNIDFYFTGTVYDQTDIETEALWVEDATPPTCSASNKGCKLTVSDQNVVEDGFGDLHPAQVAAASTGTYYEPVSNNGIISTSGFISRANKD